MTNSKLLPIMLAVLTFLGSVGGSAIVAGQFVGSVETRLTTVEQGQMNHGALPGHPDLREAIAGLTAQINALSRDVQRLERTVERARRGLSPGGE